MVEYEYLKEFNEDRFKLFMKHRWYNEKYEDLDVVDPLGRYSK